MHEDRSIGMFLGARANGRPLQTEHMPLNQTNQHRVQLASRTTLDVHNQTCAVDAQVVVHQLMQARFLPNPCSDVAP